MGSDILPAPDKAVGPGAEGSVATVLFVDDEPIVLSALRRAFRATGYRVLVAGSGEEGLTILETEEVDAVVSDMQMPAMSGAEFLEQVFIRRPDTKRILLTGHSDTQAAIAAINLGKIWRYMEKPWRDIELIATVEQAIGHRRLLRENAALMALTQSQNVALKSLNESLEQKVDERTNELRRTFLSTIQGFSTLLERRVSVNAGHSRRVADHARQLAERLGLSEQDQSDIFLAGLLHDIGKLALPDALIEKPFSVLPPMGQLDYRQHPLIGQQTLQGIPQLKQVASIVRHHHELMDGSGYPDQLTGLAIPLGARILAVANDYDALQRGGLTLRAHTGSEACQYIIKHRGRRYDPTVADAFLAMVTEKPVRAVESEHLVTPLELRPGMVLTRELAGTDTSPAYLAGRVVDTAMVAELRQRQEAAGEPIRIAVRRGAEPATLRDKVAAAPRPPRYREMVLSASRLKEGMVLARHLQHRDGYLLLARNFQLDPSIIQQLINVEATLGSPLEIYIQVPER